MSYGVWRDSKTWWKLALSRYMAKKHPEKLIFNPRLIDVSEHHIRFGMRKHYGTLRLSKKNNNRSATSRVELNEIIFNLLPITSVPY